MNSFTKITTLLIARIGFSFITCKNKPGKQTIVGRWIYKELAFTTDRNKDLNEKQ